MEEAILGPMRSCLIGQNIIQFQQLLQRIQMSCIGNSSESSGRYRMMYIANIKCAVICIVSGKKEIHTDITVSVDEPINGKRSEETYRKRISNIKD